MTVNLSALGGVAAQFFDDNGVPLAGGKLYTYAAGTTSPQATYTSSSGATPHTNPIVLDAAGRVPGGEIWLTVGIEYKFVVKTSTDVTVATYDDVYAISDFVPDASNVAYTPPYTSSVVTTVEDKLAQTLSVKDFGAVGDGVTDDTAAIQAAIAAHLSSGVPLEFNEGVFKVTSQLTIDVASLATTGVNITGAGRRRTILSSTYTSGIPFYVTCSTGGAFYHTIKNIGFQGTNDSGPVLQIGRDDYADAFNSCTFTGINVNNSSLNASCEGARFNFVLQSDLDVVANGGGTGRPGTPTAPGYGSAVVMRQVQFCRGSIAAGNANIGVKFTDGFIYANAFNAVDIEEVDTAFYCDTIYATLNRFVSGVFVARVIWDATAGASNIFATSVPSLYAGGSYFNGSNNIGIKITDRQGYSNIINQVQIFDAQPGTAASLVAIGPDTNIRVDVSSKGTGDIAFINTAGKTLGVFSGGTTFVNYPSFSGSDTGQRVTLAASGSDTNIGLTIANKGTAIIELSGQTTSTSATAGAASALPATPTGYLSAVINGATVKIPYYS